MKKRRKTLLIAVLALCISTLLAVGGTYALFTDKVEVNNHLKAGNLDVGLERISYIENVLNNETGLMNQSEENKDVIDLTKDSKVLFSAENAVPTSWYQATIRVSNKGSVAFNYGMKILWNENGKANNAQMAFADQMHITVTDSTGKAVTFKLSDCANNAVNLGDMLKGEAETFTVKAEFINDNAVNNAAMLATLKFDLQVYATQKTA